MRRVEKMCRHEEFETGVSLGHSAGLLGEHRGLSRGGGACVVSRRDGLSVQAGGPGQAEAGRAAAVSAGPVRSVRAIGESRACGSRLH